MRVSLYTSCGVFALSLGGAARPCSAQGNTQISQAANPSARLEEVVVTAQKRSEKLQKAPLAITALGSQALREQHITSPTDLNRVVPDLLVNAGGAAGDSGSSSSVFSIRGLGASGQGNNGAPAVAVHLDGHYLQSGLASNEFYDLQRIEVSPGPQGTLYGRSAAAGAVNIIINKPVDRYEGDAELEGGSYGEFRGAGMVNVPVTDTLWARIAGQYQRHDSYFNNGFGDLDSGSVRGQLLWTPIDDLKVHFTTQYLHNGGQGSTPIFVGPDATALLPSGDIFNRSVGGYTIANGRVVPVTPSVDDTKIDILGEISYDFGPTILTISPTYEHTDVNNLNNPIASPYSTYNYDSDVVQKGVEVRFNDPGSTRLKWVVGFNYFDYDIHVNVDEVVVPDVLDIIDAGPFAGPQVVHAFDTVDRNTQTSKAVFGQATYPIFDALRLTFGARQNWDDATYQGHLGTTGVFIGGSPNLLNPPFGPGPLLTPALSSSVSFSKATYKVALDYDLAPASLVYASFSTGYKPGGLNDGGPPSSNVPPTPLAPSQVFQPEKVDHYEVGSKNRFFGNRLQINDAVYYDDYKDYQNGNTQPVNPLAIGAIGFVISNAGTARVYGNEFSAEFLATPNDKFSAAVNYLNATFTKYDVAAYVGTGGVFVPAQSYAGYTLPNAPHWSGNLSYSHRFDLQDGSLVTALASSYLTTSYYAYFQDRQGTQQGAYTKTLLSLTWQNPKRDISISAFVKNLEDKGTFIAGGYSPPFSFVFADAPRTVGVTLSKHF